MGRTKLENKWTAIYIVRADQTIEPYPLDNHGRHVRKMARQKRRNLSNIPIDAAVQPFPALPSASPGGPFLVPGPPAAGIYPPPNPVTVPKHAMPHMVQSVPLLPPIGPPADLYLPDLKWAADKPQKMMSQIVAAPAPAADQPANAWSVEALLN